MPLEERRRHYESYLAEASQLAEKLQKHGPLSETELEGMLGDLQFFTLPECCTETGGKKTRKSVMGKIKSIFGK